jgi:hypothetical protein
MSNPAPLPVNEFFEVRLGRTIAEPDKKPRTLIQAYDGSSFDFPVGDTIDELIDVELELQNLKETHTAAIRLNVPHNRIITDYIMYRGVKFEENEEIDASFVILEKSELDPDFTFQNG